LTYNISPFHHHHWLESPVWTLAFFRSLRQSPASRCFFSFRDKSVFPRDGVVNSTPNPQLFWRTSVFCRGCLPYLVGPNLKVSGTSFPHLHDLAVKTLPRSHDVDVHASGLVGIDGITSFDSTHAPARCVPLGPILPL
jgi:hypothetical protein